LAGRFDIVISPIGHMEPNLTEAVCQEVRRLFHLNTEVVPLMSDVEYAFDRERNQYHSTRILDKLAEMAPPGAVKVLALTRVDLFIPILTFVYGEAQLGGTAGIVSTSRLKDNLSALRLRECFFDRTAKEAVHELAHTFNLRHCRDATCIMHYCRNIRDVDRKRNMLCRYCRTILDDEFRRLGILI
jgi:archaemetzincin